MSDTRIMDFPQAWAYVAETELDEHDPKCSYRVGQRGLLCDCFIIWDEYNRRKGDLMEGLGLA